MTILRILSFNIHGGYDIRGHRSLRRIHTLMDEFDIDIGVFQEMETRPSRGGTSKDVDVLAGPDRPYHLPGPTLKEGLGWYGNLIVSRYPIIRALAHNLENKLVTEPRNALDALIETPEKAVRIIGTHLSLSSVVRWWEITNLIELIDQVEEEEEKDKHPVFFMGDINEWRWPSQLLKHLNTIMTPLSAGKTFPSFLPLFSLDRAWYDGLNIQATAQKIKRRDTLTMSDHLPILIKVESL